MYRPGRRRRRKLGPARRGDYHYSAECQVQKSIWPIGTYSKRKKNSHRGFGKHRLRGRGGVPVSRNARRQGPPIESTEITFSSENMEVRHPDHRRPFYLVASIYQIPIKKALVDTSTSINLIPLSTLQAVGISERKIQGCPMEVMGFGGKGEYIASHI